MYNGSEYGIPRYGREQRLVPVAMVPRPRQPQPQPQPQPQSQRPLQHLSPEPRVFAEFSAIYMGSVPLGAGYNGAEPSLEDVARAVSFLRDRTEAFRRDGTRLKMYVIEVRIDKVSFKQLGKLPIV